ncbi:hypothetical protein BH23GEM9_BH23GEM9_07220 [soil metagenome]
MIRLLVLLIAALCAVPMTAAPLAGQAAIEGDGAAALGVSLRRLGTVKRVLMIAAHPDDENTALIAELALGDGADVAYLSLTRGEGGQNLIGPELQEGLGLIRTEELLAARRLDGALQFFSRAYDFGFSKSAAETFGHWPRDTILADVVEVIRRYRPDIVVSVFSGTPADGHGHHQAAGTLAREAFAAAADPARFVEHAARGLRPHQSHYLFQALYRPPPNPPLSLVTGDLDPLFGRSRYQIAMQSRSRHRSQDMGRAEPIGPQSTALTVLSGAYPPGASSLFARLDTTLTQRARSAAAAAATISRLEEYERLTHDVRTQYNPLRAHELVPPLARLMRLLDSLELPADGTAAVAALRDAVADERRNVGDALRQASGVVVDVVSDTPRPVPGESFTVTVSVWNGGATPARMHQLALDVPPAWTVTTESLRTTASGAFGGGDQTDVGQAITTGIAGSELAPNSVLRSRFTVAVPADAQPTEAYFLREQRSGSLYRWDVADSVRALPFEPATVRARLAIEVGALFGIEREATYVDVDKAVGEIRRPLRIVPPVAVSTEPRMLIVAADDADRFDVSVTLASAAAAAIDGAARLDVPRGWSVQPARHEVRLGPGESRAVRFTVTPPPGAGGEIVLRARFDTDRGTFRRGYSAVAYPHIRDHNLFRDADVRVSAFALRIADNLRVGYIEGAGDDGAAALRQMGATVEQLDATAIAGGDLAQYDAIVAGIRAYEVRTDLLAHNERLIEYARNGGTFIVQYNKYELVDSPFMPYPATMSRPHGRITDETAEVTFIDSGHPLLLAPNRITSADFDGWVQERGLYFLDTFDSRYTPLLAMADPGEAPLDGALVAARLGDGWYVYTGLALFRQLPEGVPGAWRLLANLVSLGRSQAQ